MSKETQKIYKKLIDDATSKIVISISRAAFDITNDVCHDLMVSVRDEIDRDLQRMDEVKTGKRGVPTHSLK